MPVTLRCKKCGEPIQRSVFAPFDWVHVEDYMSIDHPDGTYDHPAAPDVLDLI